MSLAETGAEWPSPRRYKPKSLFRFLTDRGGLQPCPDLKYILDGSHGWMVRRSGMTLDRAREACVEAGYLNDPSQYTGNVSDSTIADLLELIAAEARGIKQYAYGEWPCGDEIWDQERLYGPSEPEDEWPGDANPPAVSPAGPKARKETRGDKMTEASYHSAVTRQSGDMTAAQFRRALNQLGLSVYASGPVLGLSLRQAQRIAAGESPVPRPVAKLLRLMLRLRVDPADVT